MIKRVRLANFKLNLYANLSAINFIFQVKGTIILISADVDETMRKLLPIDQNLFPVSLKRKLEYEGFYIREIIDKEKLRTFYNWYKRNNPHFREMELDLDLIDEFCESIRKMVDSTEKVTIVSNPVDEIENNVIEEIPLARQYPTLLCDKYEQDTEQDTVSNRLANIIIDYEISHRIPVDEFDQDDPEILNSDFEEDVSSDESDTDESPQKKVRLENVSVAPGEGGKFETFGDSTYLEEKSFTNLFFYGVDGFLDINRKCKNKIGFAAYCRSRIKSIDPRFREDPNYLFFLQITKEKIEIKRSIQTYMRQSRRTPGLNRTVLNQVGVDNLDKYNKRYSAYKNIRGTTMYYQSMKRDAMAFLRQLGSPTIFFTVSFAEFKDPHLFREVLQTVLDRKLSEEEIEAMELSQTEQNRIITENVVQTTVTFERRLQKLMALLTNQHFTTTKSGKRMFVEDFFYRIEFQLRYTI